MTSIERTLAMEGMHTTLQTVKSTIKRWKITGDVTDCPGSVCPVKLPEEHYCCIDDSLAMNDELTESDLKDIHIKRFSTEKVQNGVRTIARVRNELSWSFTTA